MQLLACSIKSFTNDKTFMDLHTFLDTTHTFWDTKMQIAESVACAQRMRCVKKKWDEPHGQSHE